MTAKSRKPLTFDINTSPPTETEVKPKIDPLEERKQIGARITVSKYRRLKAKAAMEGVPVQVLVERAVDLMLE